MPCHAASGACTLPCRRQPCMRAAWVQAQTRAAPAAAGTHTRHTATPRPHMQVGGGLAVRQQHVRGPPLQLHPPQLCACALPHPHAADAGGQGASLHARACSARQVQCRALAVAQRAAQEGEGGRVRAHHPLLPTPPHGAGLQRGRRTLAGLDTLLPALLQQAPLQARRGAAKRAQPALFGGEAAAPQRGRGCPRRGAGEVSAVFQHGGVVLRGGNSRLAPATHPSAPPRPPAPPTLTASSPLHLISHPSSRGATSPPPSTSTASRKPACRGGWCRSEGGGSVLACTDSAGTPKLASACSCLPVRAHARPPTHLVDKQVAEHHPAVQHAQRWGVGALVQHRLPQRPLPLHHHASRETHALPARARGGGAGNARVCACRRGQPHGLAAQLSAALPAGLLLLQIASS